MNMEVNDFKVRQQEYWALQQAREDRAAVAAMDVVEELSGAQSDDWQFNYLMEFFGMHIAEVVRKRITSGWQETPLEANLLERVADYAEHIAQWRDEGETRHIFVALEELAKAARHAARYIREEDARPAAAPF